MSITITIKVIPKSGKQVLIVDKSKALKVYLKNPPEDGKANRELIKFFADTLNIPQAAVFIVKGLTARTKTLSIATSLTLENIYQRFGLEYQKNI